MQHSERTPTTEKKRRRLAAVLAACMCLMLLLRASTIAEYVAKAQRSVKGQRSVKAQAKKPQSIPQSPKANDDATVPPREFALVNPDDAVQMVGRAGPPIPVGPGQSKAQSDALPLAITGAATQLLAPGISSPLVIEITNPNAAPVVLDTLDVSFVGPPSCDGPTNFATIRAYTGTFSVAPGRNQIDKNIAPIIAMRNLPQSQDACKAAKIRLQFTGVAHQ